MSKEFVVLVDENDNEIGLEEKMAAHEKGLLHRAFSVLVFRKNNNNLELLLHRRNKDKYHCGGLWTNTCCSHPRKNETIIAAGNRRLQEEMGFSVKLEKVGSFLYKADFENGLTEHELDHVLVGYYNNEQINPNPLEVDSYKWLEVSAIFTDMQANSNAYTPWFGKALTLALTRVNSKN